MRIKILLQILLFFAVTAFPQAGSYYNSISTSSVSFVTDLESRIRSPYTKISYDQFDETNVANFAAVANADATKSVYCVYSHYEHRYTGTFSWGTMSREHTWCHSWMPTYSSSSGSEYSDQHHLFPTHQNSANGVRSNHPLGIVNTITSQFLDGKYGTNTNGDNVYEPRSQHKGDAARAILYMALRYDGVNGNTWNFNWLNNTRLPALSEGPQDLATLIAWHKQDPPDKWEIDRNNYIQSIQQNRNPLIDHPEYVNYINFNTLTKLSPSYAAEASNYVTGFSGSPASNSITLNWTDAASGAQAPSGYLLVGYNYNNYFLPVDGETYSNDADFTDGKVIVNINYSDIDSYTFNSLVTQTSYYFTLYSYNGDGSLRNYKIDGSLPQTNATTSGTAVTMVSFVTGSASINEAGGTYNLALSLSNPSPTVATTVDVALISGNAVDINNYTTQTVTFPANSSAQQNVTITVTNDILAEGDEVLTFALQNISGGISAQIITPSEFNLTVLDNDVTRVLFTSSTGNAGEGDGTYNLSVSIENPGSVSSTSVQVQLVSGDAADLNNYITQTVTFPANTSSAQNVTVTITDDALSEGSENFDFNLVNVSGGNSAIISSPSLFTFTVADNDISSGITLLDNFNRANSNSAGNTPTSPTSLAWTESETVASTSVQVNSNMLRLSSGTAGRDFAYINLSLLSSFPVQLNTALTNITWAFNFRPTRTNPSGFDASNYGTAFVLASSSDLTTGSGYAIALGNSGAADPLRLVKFTNGFDANANLTNIVSSGDFDDQYFSVRLVFIPSTSTWELYAESNASAFPQSDPRNTGTLIGSVIDNTYTGVSLNYLVCLWNHATTASESAVFDDIYISDPQGVLPVELIAFNGTAGSNAVSLTWSTASEINNYGFEIERQAGNSVEENWETIGFVKGSGNSNSVRTYTYADIYPAAGKNYYRLKQIDMDGISEYSEVIEVQYGSIAESFALNQNYPNPFNPATAITFSIPESSPVQLKVYDVLGNQVALLLDEKKEAGHYTITFNAKSYPSGIYFYELRTDNFTAIKKMILLK